MDPTLPTTKLISWQIYIKKIIIKINKNKKNNKKRMSEQMK
jgi:hypothetical protein